MPLKSSEDHVDCCSLGALAVSGVHLAEVPFDSEEDIASHDQTVGVFLVVGSDRVGQVPGLVEDVIDLDAEIECLDVLGNLSVPLPFRGSVTLCITSVPGIGYLGVEFEFVLCPVVGSGSYTGVEGVHVDPVIQGVAGNMAGEVGLDPSAETSGSVFETQA